MGEEADDIGKGVATNKNELELELDSKNFKAQLSKIGWL